MDWRGWPLKRWPWLNSHRAGLNYVSCSPFRVAITRLAAEQAVEILYIRKKGGEIYISVHLNKRSVAARCLRYYKKYRVLSLYFISDFKCNTLFCF